MASSEGEVWFQYNKNIMKKQITVCDTESCKVDSGCQPFHLFKERKLDGAGSPENWYYQCDLCFGHSAILLQEILQYAEKDDALHNHILKICKDHKIRHRVE